MMGNSFNSRSSVWEYCELGDLRLSKRASMIASKMLEKPNSLIPQQMGSWAFTKACYRFLDNSSVNYGSLILPHFRETRTTTEQHETVLCIHDTSDINFGMSSQIDGFSQVGKGLSKGFLLHSSLAVVSSPSPKVLGLLNQEIYYRKEKPKNESKKSRYCREKESDLWINALRAIGAPQGSTKYIDIMDRGADIYRVMEESILLRHDFIIRAAYNRNLFTEEKKLFDLVRDAVPQGTAGLLVRKSQQHKKRIAKLKVASKEIVIRPPYPFQNNPPLKCIMVYAKERRPPKNEDPIEWFILSSLDGSSFEKSCRIIDMYAMRWIIEEYHKCLKTGCRLEERQLKNSERIERLMGFLSIVALRLLQIKEQVKSDKRQLARDHIDSLTLQLLEKRNSRDTTSMTLRDFWIEVAKIGGFLARKSDGDPGWITIWRGWNELQKLCEGARLMRCG